MSSEANLNDDSEYDDDSEEEYHRARAMVVAGMAQELSEVAASDIGLYAKAELPVQQLPGTDEWIVQMSFQIGLRAYDKVKPDVVKDSDAMFRSLEAELLRDEMIRELNDEDED